MSVQGQFRDVPVPGVRMCRPAAPAAGRAAAAVLPAAAGRADRRILRLCHLRPSGRPGHGLLQQLRARLGTARRSTGREHWSATSACPCGCGRPWRRSGWPPSWPAAGSSTGQEVPRPWTLVPIGATIPDGAGRANLSADPRTHGKQPLPNRVLATRPLGPAGIDGLLAVPVALAAADLLAGPFGHSHATVLDGAGVLAVSGCWPHPTMRFVEEPLRERGRAQRSAGRIEQVRVPLWTRLRRPTIALGSTVALLGVARDRHVVHLARAASPSSGPRAWNCRASTAGTSPARGHCSTTTVPKAADAAHRARGRQRSPGHHVAGLHRRDFRNGDVVNCTPRRPERRPNHRAGRGSHAEHWITALDALGKQQHFKVVTYLKMGCALSTDPKPLVMGNNDPYPRCYVGAEAMDKTGRRSPRLRVHHLDAAVEHQTRRRHAGHLCRNLEDVRRQQDSGSGDTRHPVAGRGRQAVHPGRLSAQGGDAVSCGRQAVRGTVGPQPDAGPRGAGSPISSHWI